MSVSSQVVSRFAEVTGRNPHTIVRMLVILRAAGLVPKGGPGGGKASAHFNVSHMANVVLGLAGPQPSDAAEATSSLRAIALGEFVERLIRSGEAGTDWSLELCLRPLSARVLRGTAVDMTFTAGAEAGPPPGVRVVTVLTLPVILAAADLARPPLPDEPSG